MPLLPAINALESTAYSTTEQVAAPLRNKGTAIALALSFALVPALGIPSEWVLQDTFKSALLATGVWVAVALWLAAALRAAAQHPVDLHWHGVLGLPAVLCLYAAGSMAWSHTYLAGVEASRWAVLGALLWACLQALRAGHGSWLVGGIHAGAVGASAWAAAQFWGDLAWFPQVAQPASVFANRNFFAEYLVSTLPFSVYALTQVRAPRWRQWMALSVAFNIVALLMTGTRSALIAAAIVLPGVLVAIWRFRGTLALAAWSRGSKVSVALVVLAGVLCLGVIPTGNPAIAAEGYGTTPFERSVLRAGSVARPAEYTEGSFSVRADMWKSSLRMLMAQPWTGVGAGAWEVHIPRYQGRNNSTETDFYAHNEPVQLLAEYGLVVGGGVLAVLLAYLLLAAQTAWRKPARSPDAANAALRAIALCSLLGLLLVSNAGFPWRLASTGALLMVGLAFVADAAPREQRVSRRALRVAAVAAALAGMLILTASVQAVRAESSIVRSVQTLNLLILQPDLAAEPRQALQDRAWGLLKEGVAIHPHYRKLTAQAADQFAATGNLDAALWALDSIAASRPFIPDVHANRVLLHSRLQHPEAAQAALQALTALQPDAPRTRALGILLMRRAGQDGQAALQLQDYFRQGRVEYDLVRFALSIGLDNKNEALAIQAYRLWVQGWPGEASAQADALTLAPAAWRERMLKR